jgi:hypothetical protein
MEVGRGNLNRQRIGGFVKPWRKRCRDDVEHAVEAVVGLEDGAAGLSRRDQAVAIELREHGERLHHVADLLISRSVLARSTTDRVTMA